MIRAAPLLALLLLAACGQPDDAASGVTKDEARQLDEAAAKTDINAVFAEDNGTDSTN